MLFITHCHRRRYKHLVFRLPAVPDLKEYITLILQWSWIRQGFPWLDVIWCFEYHYFCWLGVFEHSQWPEKHKINIRVNFISVLRRRRLCGFKVSQKPQAGDQWKPPGFHIGIIINCLTNQCGVMSDLMRYVLDPLVSFIHPSFSWNEIVLI
jgi:hypothetical protein